jgi:DNA-binding MarR family transcriptional regulator
MVAANEVSSAVLQDNEVPVTGDFSAASLPGPYRLDSSTGHLLRRALQRHQALFQECAAGTGLTPPQFAALTKLAELRRVTQNRLGRLVAMDPATAQGVMKRLALRGLLRTEKDPMDRRTVVLSITQEGECLVQKARHAGQRANQTLMQELDAGEQAMLLALLRRITD